MIENNCTRPGYSSLDNGKNCYKVYLEKKAWNDAKKYCEQVDGGQLVSITDGFEQALMYLLTYVKTQSDPWIGLIKVNQIKIFKKNSKLYTMTL